VPVPAAESVSAPRPAETQAAPGAPAVLHYCPNCGCHLTAIRAALELSQPTRPL
jgi:predicted RNA-binding Zn-ribbon protein involved in translation (DUF1610 family)